MSIIIINYYCIIVCACILISYEVCLKYQLKLQKKCCAIILYKNIRLCSIRSVLLIPFCIHFTLWPFHTDKLKFPLKPTLDGGGGATDLTGKPCYLYPQVASILSQLSELVSLAVASRIEDIACAYQMLYFSDISHFFPIKEIYPSSKTVHLTRLQERSGFSASDILFFDDDKRSIRDATKLGVKSIQVLDGLTWSCLFGGLSQFSQ